MTREQLDAILAAHKRWVNGDEGGVGADLRWANLHGANLRGANLHGANLHWANLSGADLRWADLRWANLRWANLRWANLHGANLRGANLHGADLSGADLSGAEGIFDSCKWIAENLQRTRGGVFAYKVFGGQYKPPSDWEIKPGSVIAENVNPLPTLNCACGVNVATLDWCRKTYPGMPVWRVFVKWEWMAAGVIPWNTDGKFRVPRAKLIEIVGEDES